MGFLLGGSGGGPIDFRTVPDGTLAAPGLAFLANDSTGLYRPGSGQIGFTSNGAEVLRTGGFGAILKQGTFENTLGSAAAPSFTFDTDPDTGLFSVAADTLGVSVGGAQVFSFSGTTHDMAEGTTLNLAAAGTSGLLVKNDINGLSGYHAVIEAESGTSTYVMLKKPGSDGTTRGDIFFDLYSALDSSYTNYESFSMAYPGSGDFWQLKTTTAGVLTPTGIEVQVGSSAGGTVRLTPEGYTGATANSGEARLEGGFSGSKHGGRAIVRAGSPSSGNFNGGDVEIYAGSKSGTGVDGKISLFGNVQTDGNLDIGTSTANTITIGDDLSGAVLSIDVPTISINASSSFTLTGVTSLTTSGAVTAGSVSTAAYNGKDNQHLTVASSQTNTGSELAQVRITAADGTNLAGNSVIVTAGDGGTAGNGGNIDLNPGTGTGGGNDGVINTSGDLERDGSRILSTRKTGWTAATGTATRTSFDTSTVTLSELAERVKALLDDLNSSTGHGLIN